MRYAVVLLISLLAGSAVAVSDSGRPVYVYLFTTVDDHLNIQLSEDRVRRALSTVEKLRAQYPAFGASALFQFTGAASEQFSVRNGAAKLVDALQSAAGKGFAEIGYTGENEPTPGMRPIPNFRGTKTLEERWLARGQAAEWFLTEARHFLTGEPDPSKDGGLKRTVQVFGEPASVAGVSLEIGSDPEAVHHVRRFARAAVMTGLIDGGSWLRPSDYLPGYSGALGGFGVLMSPAQDCSPELYWQDSILRISESSGPPVRVVSGHEGPEAMKTILAKLDRSRPHVIRVELGYYGMHLRPDANKDLLASPIGYAYTHWKLPSIPEEVRLPRGDVDANYARQEALLKYLVEDFFPAHPGSRFVSSAELRRMAATSSGSGVSRTDLEKATKDLLARWDQNNYPPAYAFTGEQYFSLADMFQMLVTALGELHRSSTVPDSVPANSVYGPLEMTDMQGPSQGSVTVAAVARVCAELSSALNDQEWRPLPRNQIPVWVTVDGLRLNSAQFLRLMAQALSAPEPRSGLNVRTCRMFSPAAEVLPVMRRMRSEMGAWWTVKPARLRVVE